MVCSLVFHNVFFFMERGEINDCIRRYYIKYLVLVLKYSVPKEEIMKAQIFINQI